MPKIFSASSDEWTDDRIREFGERMEASRLGKKIESKETKEGPQNTKDTKNGNMVHYETFESSSEDEQASKCLFESQALSYQNRDKMPTSQEKENKRIERIKRKERKLNEKLKVKKENER